MTKASKTEREFNEALRQRLVKLRKENDWSQEQMAELLGIPYPGYPKYENEKLNRGFPIYLLPRLSILTHTRIEWIVTGKGPKHLLHAVEQDEAAA